jgi:hypothetical protein
MEPFEMRKHRLSLDSDTIDRLLDGRIDQSDAPPGYAAMVDLLSAAATTPPGEDIDGDLLGLMVHAIHTNHPSPDRKPPMISKTLSAKVVTGIAALVLSTTGVAAAATGNLPDPAQDAISKVADRVGFDVPPADEDGTDIIEDEVVDDGTEGTDTDTDADGGSTGNVDNPTDADQHGVDVSGVARDTELTGREKGAAVSETARAGHGPDVTTTTVGDDATVSGKPTDPGSKAPVDTPNGGGTGTASDASGGRSDAGTSRAPGQAAAGSGNAGSATTP